MALFPPKTDGEATGESAETDATREEVRTLIREQMDNGEISRRPEEEPAGRERG